MKAFVKLIDTILIGSVALLGIEIVVILIAWLLKGETDLSKMAGLATLFLVSSWVLGKIIQFLMKMSAERLHNALS